MNKNNKLRQFEYFSKIQDCLEECSSKILDLYNEFDLSISYKSDNSPLTKADIFSQIKHWAPEGVDIILDPVGANYLEKNLSVLGIEGRLVIIGLMGGAKANLNLGHLMIKRQKIIGSTIRARSIEVKNLVMEKYIDMTTNIITLS